MKLVAETNEIQNNLNTDAVFDPFYHFSDVPEGVQIPEFERLDLICEYVEGLMEKIEEEDNQSIEALWPKVQLWNATVKLPYPNDEYLRETFDALVKFILHKNAREKKEQSVEAGSSDGGKGPSQSTRLVNMILENPNVTLFKDEYDVAHIRIPVEDHSEVWPCKSGALTRWLGGEFYRLTRGKTVAGRESMKDAVSLLEGRAINECEEHRLFNRVAQTPEAVWYDLADKKWRAVRITQEGWSIVTDVPMLFRRFSHLAPQVEPMRGGSVRDVLPFVNVTDPEQQALFLVHLVASFIPGWPHPALYVYGSQGSAKSTLSRIVRKLIDPSKIEVVSLTRHEGDLAQQLGHHAFLFFDNVSEMPDWISDLLCRAITGGGFSKRELYSDDADIIRYVMANIGINGINIASNRADLLERSLLLKLERMDKSNRRQEYDLMSDFEIARPRILGAIFDAVSKAMALKPNIKVAELPRMADFALWGCAISEALGIGQEAFLAAYFRNISSQSEELINDNTVASILVAIVNAHDGMWEGTPRQLFKTFKDQAMDDKIADSRLPASPSALTREINRLKTPLEETGIQVISSSDGNDRNIAIKRIT